MAVQVKSYKRKSKKGKVVSVKQYSKKGNKKTVATGAGKDYTNRRDKLMNKMEDSISAFRKFYIDKTGAVHYWDDDANSFYRTPSQKRMGKVKSAYRSGKPVVAEKAEAGTTYKVYSGSAKNKNPKVKGAMPSPKISAKRELADLSSARKICKESATKKCSCK